MTLERALFILATVHTRDDEAVGFAVLAGAQWRPYETPFSEHDYITAWEVVRAHVHMQTTPRTT